MGWSSVTKHDAFLSYNSKDYWAVEELARRLREEGLELYLDDWEMDPGRLVQPDLIAALTSSRNCVVFPGPHGLGRWQDLELQATIKRLVEYRREPAEESFRVVRVLLPGFQLPPRDELQSLGFLSLLPRVEFLKSLDDERVFRRLVWAITGRKPRENEIGPDGPSPYQGLESFGPKQAGFFFGREDLTSRLVSAVKRSVEKEDGVRFLAVLGPSGNGKTSLVMAGLLPWLTKGAIPGSESWPVAVLMPGAKPLESLASAVVPPLRMIRPDPGLSDLDEVRNLLRHLGSGEPEAPTTLNRYVSQKFLEHGGSRRLVIVVDRFEELFT